MEKTPPLPPGFADSVDLALVPLVPEFRYMKAHDLGPEQYALLSARAAWIVFGLCARYNQTHKEQVPTDVDIFLVTEDGKEKIVWKLKETPKKDGKI